MSTNNYSCCHIMSCGVTLVYALLSAQTSSPKMILSFTLAHIHAPLTSQATVCRSGQQQLSTHHHHGSTWPARVVYTSHSNYLNKEVVCECVLSMLKLWCACSSKIELPCTYNRQGTTAHGTADSTVQLLNGDECDVKWVLRQ